MNETPKTSGEGRIPSRIALIGFMASGKSSVGRLLAPLLGYRFVDLDERIVRRAGASIPEIFRKEGESGFRRLERECLALLTGEEGLVLSCGGGVVVTPENRIVLMGSFEVVWIRISAAEAVRRASFTSGSRPLLDLPEPLVRARELLDIRDPLYRLIASFIVETDSTCMVQSTVESIYEHLCPPL